MPRTREFHPAGGSPRKEAVVLTVDEYEAVRLIDLRHDYVLRQLERHDWQYVSRITGLEAAAMNVHFAAYLTEKKVSTRIRRKAAPQIDEFALWKLLQAEQDTPAGAALWLTWQLGLQVEEIASLRWDQVDLQKERLILPDRPAASCPFSRSCARRRRQRRSGS